MATRPISHSVWQSLRVAKRSTTPPTGKQLRVTPSRKTKDGTFLTALVEEGLLVRVTGSAEKPFEATYALTALGEYAAEYGEFDHNKRLEPPVPPPVTPPPLVAPPTPSKVKWTKRSR
jgi:hypothetical protein